MTRKSQVELESPAKVYQLDAVDAKVDRALELLSTISQQTAGVVSQTQLQEVKKELVQYVDDEVLDAKNSVIEKFSPMQKALNKFVWLVVGGIVAVVTQAVIIFVIVKG